MAQSNIPGMPATNTTLEPVVMGTAVNVSTNGLVASLNLNALIDQEMTLSFWVKSNTQPFMGDVIKVSGGMGASEFALDLVQSCLNFWACGHSEPLSSSLLTGLTHYVITANGKSVILCCNGRSQVTVPFKAKLSFRDNFRLAGGSYGGLSGIYDDLRIYNKTLDADTV